MENVISSGKQTDIVQIFVQSAEINLPSVGTRYNEN